MEKRYRIVRFFQNMSRQTVKEDLTLEEAQAWCCDPETSSKTCKLPENVGRREQYGPWFDGYEEE